MSSFSAGGVPAELEEIAVDARSRYRAVAAEQLALPRLLRRLRPDLVHNLCNTAPALPGVRQVTTIHDVIYRRQPETHAGVLSWGLRVLVPLAARRSRRIVAVSQATKEDVVRFLGVRPDRVDVVPNGPGTIPAAGATNGSELRTRLALGDGPIVLAASAKRPHKNLERLIEAMASVEATLVLPGYHTPFEAELERLTERLGISARVQITGWLDEPDLEGLYEVADCVVVPSLVEGFGMPVLEAMTRAVPVACSEIPVLREVAGDAALYFDPLEPAAIAGAINRLLADATLRERLRAAGRERARLFSWEAAAKGTIASYRAAADGA